MHYIVLIKQVPEIEDVEFDMETGRIDRSSAATQVNPFDLNALEAAVSLKEEQGGTITVISMGPPQTESTLRKALARGADRAILLSDKAFAGADTWATSFTLSKAIEKVGTFDLILCGEKTIDGDTAQVGPEVARILNFPHVAYVSGVKEANGESITVKTEMWEGTYIKKLNFPGLLTITKDANEPRLPSLKDKLDAKKAEIEIWDSNTFKDVNPELFGIKGSKTTVGNVEIPEEEERKGEMLKGTPKECAKTLIEKLRRKSVISG